MYRSEPLSIYGKYEQTVLSQAELYFIYVREKTRDFLRKTEHIVYNIQEPIWLSNASILVFLRFFLVNSSAFVELILHHLNN